MRWSVMHGFQSNITLMKNTDILDRNNYCTVKDISRWTRLYLVTFIRLIISYVSSNLILNQQSTKVLVTSDVSVAMPKQESHIFFWNYVYPVILFYFINIQQLGGHWILWTCRHWYIIYIFRMCRQVGSF